MCLDLTSLCTQTKVAIVLLRNAARPAGAVDAVTPPASGFPGDETLSARCAEVTALVVDAF